MGKERARKRRRLWLGAGIAGLALFAGVWLLVERLLDVDQYRPVVEREVGRFTGLPVRVGRLDLALRPLPCLSALDVAIGSDVLQLTASRVDLFAALLPLLWRTLDIRDVAIDELSVTLPGTVEAVKGAWNETNNYVEKALAENKAKASAPGFIEHVEVGRIRTRDARLRLGVDGPTLETSVIARGITTDVLELEVEAVLSDAGAHAQGNLFMPLNDSAEEKLHGRFDVHSLRPSHFVELPALFATTWRAHIDVVGEPQGVVRAALEGTFAPELEGALEGTVVGSARFGDEITNTALLELAGDGLEIRASVDLSGQTILRVERFSASGAALAGLVALADTEAAQLVTTPTATLEAHDATLAFRSGAGPLLVGGTLEARGLAVERNGERVVEDLRADALLADGSLAITELRGGPLALRASLTPDASWSHVDLALSGTLALADPWLHALGVPEALRDASGTLWIDALTGRFPSAPDAEPLKVSARLTGGSLRIASESAEDTVSGIDLALTSRDARILLEGRANSSSIGAVVTSATLDPTEGKARGSVDLDVSELAVFLTDPATRERIAPLLHRYGASRFDFAVSPIDGPGSATQIRVTRPQAPRVELELQLGAEGQRDALGDVEATAEVPAEGLVGLLPGGARASGSGSIHLHRSAAERTFVLTADLGALGVAAGAFVEKTPGESLKIAVDGSANEEGWTPRRVTATSQSGKVSVGLETDGVVAPDLSIDLADWSFLLVDTARASGLVRGSLDTRAGTARLRLAEVGLIFSPEVGIDSIDGEVSLAGDDWNVDGLRIRGAQSDASLTAAFTGGKLGGRLTGANLDVDFVRALVGEINALLPEAEEPEPWPSMSGAFDVELDRFGYGRSEARNLAAHVVFREDGMSIEGLSFDGYEGHVSGAVLVDARGATPLLSLDLDIADITGRFLDDLFAAEPRGITGRFTGKLRFAAPLHGDLKATLAEANGSLAATAIEGTFGRLGIATKLVTVLRATEALRLKVPALKDGGLVFDTTKADLAMEQGRLTVNDFELDSTSYMITATGHLDFGKDESKVPIEVNAIKGLTGLVDFIPVAGDVLQIVNVRLAATGSPYDLKIGIASIQDQVIGAGMAGPKAVIKGVRDVWGLLRRKGDGEAVPAPESETAAPAPAPVLDADAAESLPPDGAAMPPADDSSEPDPDPGSGKRPVGDAEVHEDRAEGPAPEAKEVPSSLPDEIP